MRERLSKRTAKLAMLPILVAQFMVSSCSVPETAPMAASQSTAKDSANAASNKQSGVVNSGSNAQASQPPAWSNPGGTASNSAAQFGGSAPGPTAPVNNKNANSSATPSITPNPAVSQGDIASGAASFHIRAGTGNNAWNDAATPISMKLGGTVTIYNDDSVTHWVHTNGAPFFHPFSGIAPGQSVTYTAILPYSGAPLHDHLTYGSVYIQTQ